MEDRYFVFNGIDSRDMDIIVSKMPTIAKPERRVKEIQIESRNGVLHEDLGTFDNYTKSIECAVKNQTWKRSFDEIFAWLSGSGKLIVSIEPDKVYRTFIKNQIPISDVLRCFPKFLIQFDCYPLKYSVNQSEEELTITAPTTIYNGGTYYSEPVITIYGTGNITLTINGKVFVLSSVNGYLTINAEIMEVYKDGVNCNNQFVAEDFPHFEVGANELSFTGNVQKIEIFMNRRWI